MPEELEGKKKPKTTLIKHKKEEVPVVAVEEAPAETVEEESYECPECGTAVTPDMATCPNCGVGLTFEDSAEE